MPAPTPNADQGKPDEKVDAPKPGPKVAPEPEPEAPADEAKVVEVTLVHPDLDAKVTVPKPSAEYTNFVRGYGYREATK